MSQTFLSQKIRNKAVEIGFDLVGIAPAKPHKHFVRFERWIEKGYAAGMDYLKKNGEKRGDPQKILEGAETIICCGLGYYHGYPFSTDSFEAGRGWISNYARGRDYHEVLLQKLESLENFIRLKAPGTRMKSYVDTGPILERSYGAMAGLGWIGKNTCLIHPKKGSLFFIGEILTNLDLDYSQPMADHCGTCTRCIEACPTEALKAHILDAGKCVSYLTIEHRGAIPENLRKKMGHNLVGCDVCQDVCPWNRKLPHSAEESFRPEPGRFHPLLDSFGGMTPEEFSKRFKGSAIKRVKWKGFMRNLEIVSKNTGVMWPE